MAKGIKWNMKTFKAIRFDPGVQARLDAAAEAISAEAGEGYETSSYRGRTRARATVITATPRAMVDNQKRNTLLRSIHAGR